LDNPPETLPSFDSFCFFFSGGKEKVFFFKDYYFLSKIFGKNRATATNIPLFIL